MLSTGRLGPHHASLRVAVGTIGRPKKGQETGPTRPRSVRFPEAVWRELEARAKARGLSLHAALRIAALEWAARSKPRRTTGRRKPAETG